MVCYAMVSHSDVSWVLQCAFLGTIPDGWTYDTLPLAVELTMAGSGRHLRNITHRYVSVCRGGMS